MSKKIIYSFCLLSLFLRAFVFSMQSEGQVRVRTPYSKTAFRKLTAYDPNSSNCVKKIKNKNLKKINLKRKNLSEIELFGCDLNGAQLAEVDFIGAKLLNIKFKEGGLSSISFIGANLNKIDFTETTIFNSIFSHSLIVNSIFHNSNFMHCKFGSMLIKRKKENGNGNIITPKIIKNKFNFGNFEHCTFKKVAFSENSFFRSILKDTLFKKCIFFTSDFTSAYMKNVLFEECEFIDCENLDKLFCAEEVKFNFCKFVKKDFSDEDRNKLIKDMKNLGANVLEEPGLWEKFKEFAGAVIIPVVAQTTLSYATGGAFELGRQTAASFFPAKKSDKPNESNQIPANGLSGEDQKMLAFIGALKQSGFFVG